MADAKDVTQEVAKTFVDATLKQSELMGSWSLAVFAACVALVAWYIQRRLDDASHPALKHLWLIFVGALLQGASILSMYFAYGIMINIIPELQFAKFQTASDFRKFLGDHGFDQARSLFIVQFVLFFLGICLLFVFGFWNNHLLRRRGLKNIT